MDPGTEQAVPAESNQGGSEGQYGIGPLLLVSRRGHRQPANGEKVWGRDYRDNQSGLTG